MMDEETFMDEVEAMERTLYRVSRSLLKSPEDCGLHGKASAPSPPLHP